MSTTRQHELKPDEKGRYRPRIGQLSDGQQKRFNLGTDFKEAKWRYHQIHRLYAEQWDARHRGRELYDRIRHGFVETPYWLPLGLKMADAIARGDQEFTIEPTGPGAGYSQTVEVLRTKYPTANVVPADQPAFAASKTVNEIELAQRIGELEAQLKAIGMLPTGQALPSKIVTGTLHQALDAYAEDIRKNGEKNEAGNLKQSQKGRVERVERLKLQHADVTLALYDLTKASNTLSEWRNRPVTKRGTRSSYDDARHLIAELIRFWKWLDASPQFGWEAPKGLFALRRNIAKFDSEKKLSVVTKNIYSPEQLRKLLAVATNIEKMTLLVGLNCAFGAAELGRITLDEIHLRAKHPHAQRIGWETSDTDSFIRTRRPKSQVFGEWLLWNETVTILEWGIARAKRIGTDRLFCRETGLPLYNEDTKNAQAPFRKIWNDQLVARVRKHEKTFPNYPLGVLRDTLPDVLRQQYDAELASMAVAHGHPCEADSLLESYANKPYGRLHKALSELHQYFFEENKARQ